MSSRLLTIAAGALALAGCATTEKTHIGDEDPGMGEAVKYNAALQTINPAPVYPPDAAQPGGNGDKAARAVKRYRTDQVKQVEIQQTTSSSGGGSGSGTR